MNVDVEAASPDALRADLTAQLVTDNWIRTPQVEAAFRAVPRHLFVPDTVPPAAAYADTVVITKRDNAGNATSSVSAPWLQAYMLEQARLRPGSRVLEIGSGGYNAALIAEIVGAGGQVTTVDIDPDVARQAESELDRAGYRRVQVVAADGEHGYAPNAPYDAIIITVETADVPRCWLEQLSADGVLVAPLRMRGHTRCATLRREGDHLGATAVQLCGFVPMQGAGHLTRQRLLLRGEDIVLRLDDTDELSDVDVNTLAAALDQPRIDAWSPVTVKDQEPFESLQLWLAAQPRPTGLLTAGRSLAPLLGDPQNWVVCPTLFTSDSLAYLATRKIGDQLWEFGAQGFGPHADQLTTDILDLIAVWDREYRNGPDPRITVHPHGTSTPTPRTGQPQLLVARRHSTIAVTWPAPEAPR